MILLGAAPRLGVVDWLWRSLRAADGPAMWSTRQPKEAWRDAIVERLDDGAAIVIGPWPTEVTDATRAALIGSPRPAGLIGAEPSRLAGIELPAMGPPDMVLDDHAPWAIATALAAQVRIDLVGVGDDTETAARPGGVAWLVQQALRWHDPLTEQEIEELLA